MFKKNLRGSAASLMVSDVLTVHKDDTIGDIRSRLVEKKKIYKFLDYGYVVEHGRKLLGVFSVGDLFRHKPETKVKRIMKKNPVHVSPEAKDETAAHLAIKSEIKAIPVVKEGILEGVIPAKTVLNIIHQSSQEDFLHMAGIDPSHMEYEDTMEIPVHVSVRHRAPWLLIGLVGIMIAAGIVGRFEEVLENHMILAFFIPAIVYMADALGSQHVTLSVRDIASHGADFNRIRYFGKQTFIALFLALIISSFTFFTVMIFWGEAYMGFVIGLSLFFAALVTNFTALMTTLVIDKLGKDPAFGSGPFATVVSDVTSIVIYLLVATALL